MTGPTVERCHFCMEERHCELQAPVMDGEEMVLVAKCHDCKRFEIQDMRRLGFLPRRRGSFL